METRLDPPAEQLLSSIHPELFSILVKSINQVHPDHRIEMIDQKSPTFLLAVGKNALAHAKSFLGKHKALVTGIRIHQVKGYTDKSLDNYSDDVFYVSHPLPNEETFTYTKDTIEILENLSTGSHLTVLISGGASAAFALPEPDLTPKDYTEIIRHSIASGFSIRDINRVRSLIDQVKGGKLLGRLQDVTVETWIISDVVSDDPRVVGSGITAPGIEMIPSVIAWLDKQLHDLNSSVTSDELVAKLSKSYDIKYTNHIQTNRMDLLKTIQENLEELDLTSQIIDNKLEGDIEEIQSQLSHEISAFSDQHDHVLIWSGEPTLVLPKNVIKSGHGGRVSALTCLISEIIAKYGDLIFVGIATDGKDGSSPASGYVISHETSDELDKLGGARNVIHKGSSGEVLSSLGLGIYLNNTDINLLDIFMLFIK